MQIATKDSTLTTFINTCKQHFGTRFEYESLSSTHITFYDTIHKITVTQDKSSHYKGKLHTSIKKLDYSLEVLEELIEISKGSSRPLEVLQFLEKSNKYFVIYKDLLTNITVTQRLENFKKYVVANEVKTSLKYFEESLPENFKDRYEYLDIDTRNIHFKIKGYNKILKQRIDQHLKGSPTHYEKSLFTAERFFSKSKEVHKDLYDYSQSEFKSYANKIAIICPEHGVFYQTPCNHVQGKGCRFCSYNKTSSKDELQILSSLKDYNPLSGYRPSWMEGKELDIYIPDLKLAIEYNGAVYHHSTSKVNKFFKSTSVSDTYHKDKYLLCEKAGVKLIHVFEFENLDSWIEVINKYCKFPSNFEISFSNVKRTLEISTEVLDFYGKTILNEVGKNWSGCH